MIYNCYKDVLEVALLKIKQLVASILYVIV